jgi:hypothetical protein
MIYSDGIIGRSLGFGITAIGKVLGRYSDEMLVGSRFTSNE